MPQRPSPIQVVTPEVVRRSPSHRSRQVTTFPERGGGWRCLRLSLTAVGCRLRLCFRHRRGAYKWMGGGKMSRHPLRGFQKVFFFQVSRGPRRCAPKEYARFLVQDYFTVAPNDQPCQGPSLHSVSNFISPHPPAISTHHSPGRPHFF